MSLDLFPLPPSFVFNSAFAISHVRTLRSFSGEVRDRADGSGGISTRHHFCVAVQMKMALCDTQGLVAAFAASERVSLLLELIVAALLSLNRSLRQSSRLSSIVSEVLEQKYCYHTLPVS